MAGVQSDITRIDNAKTGIANAIVAKGGVADDSEPIESYANAIKNIPDIKPLDGQTALLLGDSLVAMSVGVPENGWATYFSSITGMAIKNVAVGGATLMDKASTVLDGNPIEGNDPTNTVCNQVQKVLNNPSEYGNPAVVIVSALGNDVFKGLDITFDATELLRTFYTEEGSRAIVPLANVNRQIMPGAMRWIYENLRNLWPNAVFFFCTPAYMSLAYMSPYVNNAAFLPNVKSVTDYMGTFMIDQTKSGIWFDEPTSNGKYLYDGVHTNIRGAKALGGFIASEVLAKAELINSKKTSTW